MIPVFNTSQDNLKMHTDLVILVVILAQTHYKLLRRQAKFPTILNQNGQNDFWWFQLKSVTSYRVDKVTFTDGRTDEQTDRRRQWQYTFGPKGHIAKRHGRSVLRN